jgi:EpsD family peptidyl-prolyl cis-trans isomerase
MGEPLASSPPIAASVNGVPITEANVDLMVERALKLGTIKEASPTARKKLLEDLIFMRLAEQAVARDGNGFRPEGVPQELEITRLQTLLNIYLDAKAAPTKDPSSDQVEAFVASHPQFFSDRRVYYFTQIDIERKKQIDLAAIKTYAQSAKKGFFEAQTPEERDKAFGKLVGYVRAVAGRFSYLKGWKATEEIEASVFARLKQMKDGDVFVDEESEPEHIRVIMLQASQPVPIDADHSSRVAAQMIRFNESRRAADRLHGQLRSKADIRYGSEAKRATKSFAFSSNSTIKLAASYAFSDTFRWKHLWMAWITALIILLPAAISHFRRRTESERHKAYFVDRDILTFITNQILYFSLTPTFEFAFLIMVVVVSFLTSLSILNALSIAAAPVVLVVMIMSGIAGAVTIWAMWSSCALRFRSFTENRWIPIASLFLVQILGILSGVVT